MIEIVKRNKNIFLILIDICIIIGIYLISMLFLDINIDNVTDFIKEIVLAVAIYEIFLNILLIVFE